MGSGKTHRNSYRRTMPSKVLFASLPVKAQVRIIHLYVSTLPPRNALFPGFATREWQRAECLNECYGVGTVAALSHESFSLSTKRVNPTLDDLMDTIFADGDKLTVLVTATSLFRGGRYVPNSINPDICTTIVRVSED